MNKTHSERRVWSEVDKFKERWWREKGYIELTYTDKEIQKCLDEFPNMDIAIDMAADHHLAQGLGEVQE